MYDIDKRKSEFPNEWILKINGAKVGNAEVIFLSDTSRTVNAKIAVFTTEGKYIVHEYNGEATGKVYSINQFVNDALEAIGDAELILNGCNEYSDDHRDIDGVLLIDDVNEHNVNQVACHIKMEKPTGWETQSLHQRVGYVQNHMREELYKKLANPMYDLVQKSKLPASRATPLKDCWVMLDTAD